MHSMQQRHLPLFDNACEASRIDLLEQISELHEALVDYVSVAASTASQADVENLRRLKAHAATLARILGKAQPASRTRKSRLRE
jgi:hypothetical protein